MTKDELAKFLLLEEEGWDLDNLIASVNGEIQALMLPTWAKELHGMEGISNWLYNLLVGLVAEADGILRPNATTESRDKIRSLTAHQARHALVGMSNGLSLAEAIRISKLYYLENAPDCPLSDIDRECPLGVKDTESRPGNALCDDCDSRDECQIWVPF